MRTYDTYKKKERKYVVFNNRSNKQGLLFPEGQNSF